MIKKIYLTVIAMIVSIAFSMQALSGVNAYSEIGSITVLLEEGTSGTSTNEVEFELIKVADFIDGLYEYCQPFTDEKNDLNTVKTSEELLTIATELDKKVENENIEGYTKKTDQNGYLKFSKLEVGVYLLRIKDYASYEYIQPTLVSIPTFSAGNQNDMEFDVLVEPKHTPFKVEISKQDIATNKELPGAHLKVTDEDGNVIDEWISTNEPHLIQNVHCNHTYKLIETIAPENYKIAESIQFTVKETAEIQKVVMYDEYKNNLKTGDSTPIFTYIFLSIFSILLFIVIVLIKKRIFNKD